MPIEDKDVGADALVEDELRDHVEASVRELHHDCSDIRFAGIHGSKEEGLGQLMEVRTSSPSCLKKSDGVRNPSALKRL